MSEYSLDFSEAMSKSSKLVISCDTMPEEAQRASLYMSLVSCEISLKYIVAKAKVRVPKTHDLSKLVDLVSACTVEDEITMGTIMRVPASRIRSVVACEKYVNATLGNLLESELIGASKFPNEIRYGHVLKHFPAEVMQKASMRLLTWVKRYENSIQS